MRRGSFILILFTLATVLASPAQSVFVPGQRGGGPARTGDLTLSGVVVNAITGEPIPRALVEMNGFQTRAVLTDGSGRFQFDGLPPMQAMVVARKPGYFNRMEMQHGGYMNAIQVSPGMGTVRIALTPAGVITGQIGDADGDPVEGINIRLKRRTIQNGRSQWIDNGWATTDENGSFRIGNLIPGAYYMITSGSGRLLAMSDETYPNTYYPGAPDRADASPIQVPAGQTVVADMTLRKQPAYRISGSILGALPGQSAYVRLLGPEDESVGIGTGMRPGTNSFEVRQVPPGSYTLMANAMPVFRSGGAPNGPVRMPDTYIGKIPLVVSHDMTGVALTLQPAADIPVDVTTDFTNPQTNNRGPLVSYGPSNRVRQFVNVTLLRPNGQGAYPAQPDGDGGFVIRNVVPGRYRVEFNPTGSVYLKSATFGITDLLQDNHVVILAGGEQQPIHVAVSDNAAYIAGSVQPVESRCWVLIVPEGSTAFTARPVFVGPQGRFRSMPLPPGSYRLYAFDQVDGLEYANPDALKPYSSAAQTVAVSAGQTAEVSLQTTKVVDQ